MKLMSIKYSEFDGESKQWDLETFRIKPVNLIVGKNASGKTRTLALIYSLAKLLRGEIKPNNMISGNFLVNFEHENENYEYILKIKNNTVIQELFKTKNKDYLVRNQDGAGKIFATQLEQDIDFQTPSSELTLHVRRDNIQHPYFEPIYEWANSVYHYGFGTSLGQRTFVISRENAPLSSADFSNGEQVVRIFQKGEEEFGSSFKEKIISDLKHIDYDISDIGINPMSNIKVIGLSQNELLLGLWIKENDLDTIIEQISMSQGMFRTISLIIQLNYSLMARKPTCILIDDIGEGLDFERSCGLIELLISKIKESETQLIMSTNDRFVMNKVPLEMWSVLIRKGAYCKVYDINNAKDKFEEFKFTGLNNFDFFATNYLETENE